MTSITSSIFGRLFGHRTEINFNAEGVIICVDKVKSEANWTALTKPPVFISAWLGQTLIVESNHKHYHLSKLSYDAAKCYKHQCQQWWIEANQQSLIQLIVKIEPFISRQYLRQSVLKRLLKAVTLEYEKWFPWVLSAKRVPISLAPYLEKLSRYRHWQVAQINAFRDAYIKQQLQQYQSFFDAVESNPLTAMQRRACVIDDDNNLLLAGAGTGKTSVMVGRTGYLLKSQQAKASDILLLAYGRKAALEMDQRIKDKLGIDTIKASTFHHLGLSIIAKVESAQPNLSHFAEDQHAKAKWVQDCFEQLINQQAEYRQAVFTYFSRYYFAEKNHFEFASLGDYYQYLTDNDIRTLKGEQVKSFGELYVANWLFNHGIDYQYEAHYALDVRTIERKQYQPDFFLPTFNLYIEYYGIDENGDTAPYIDREDYHASMQWKRQTHQQHNTECIELTYAMHKQGMLLSHLKKSLSAQGIQYQPLPEQVILANLKETGRISVLAELFSSLVGLYKAACLDPLLEKKVIANAADPTQTSKALQLLHPILTAYQALLDARNEIDFEDMINKALRYIENGQFRSPWRYIMVDEFQDISEPRARLVKALRDNRKSCSIFAVGDDWQAIYRFSGGDVSLTTEFEQYFGASTQTQLDQTFRFNNSIARVATEFVSKNPSQLTKTIDAIKQVDKPAVSILRKSVVNQGVNNGFTANKQQTQSIAEVANGALAEVLTAIANKPHQQDKISVYLLARYWFQLPDKQTLAQFNKQYPTLFIENQTFHASKGKEADFVVIMGMTSGKLGFPSQKATPAIIDALLAKPEDFEYAEERRLMYVALTRAKERAYIIADMLDGSDFVKELVDGYDVELNEFGISISQTLVDKITCMLCETGTLIPRNGRFGHFFSCSHFPRCDHKERGCRQCDTAMTKSKYTGFKTCLNPACSEIVPVCDQCGAEMALRKSKKGEFWGCRNFKGNEPMSCKNGIDKAKLQWPN